MDAKTKFKKGWVYFLFSAIFLSFPLLSGLYTGHTGQILVATDKLDSDPYFKQTIIYIFDHSIWGARGLILNRPITDDNKIKKLFPEGVQGYVFNGGPVHYPDTKSIVVEQSSSAKARGWQSLLVKKYKDKYNRESESTRVFVGLSGWGMGQLEREIKNGGWVVKDFSPSYLDQEDLYLEGEGEK